MSKPSDEAVRKELREKICHDYKDDRWLGRQCDVTVEMVFDAAWQAARSAAIQECAADAGEHEEGCSALKSTIIGGLGCTCNGVRHITHGDAQKCLAGDHSECESFPSEGTTPQAERQTDSFWVVERFEDGKSAGYWDGGNSRSFQFDIVKAIQFRRKEDAFWATRGWHWKDVQITEHMMMARAVAPVETPDTHLPCGHSKWDSRRDCIMCLQFAVDELNKRLAICEGGKS